jgi:hypothetical protein
MGAPLILLLIVVILLIAAWFLAIQQGLGVLSERWFGTDPSYSFNPSSRRAVVGPFIFPGLSSGELFHGVTAAFRRLG